MAVTFDGALRRRRAAVAIFLPALHPPTRVHPANSQQTTCRAQSPDSSQPAAIRRRYGPPPLCLHLPHYRLLTLPLPLPFLLPARALRAAARSAKLASRFSTRSRMAALVDASRAAQAAARFTFAFSARRRAF